MAKGPAETTQDLARRVFVIASGTMRAALCEPLRAAGFNVQDTDEVEGIATQVALFRPDVVLVEEFLPKRTGRQVVLSLRSTGATFPVTIAGVLADVSVPTVLEWLRAGATDLWKVPFTKDIATRTRELINEIDRTQVQLAPLRTRVLGFAARARLTGTVRVFPGTPFEGAASFVEGELQEGRFGSLQGDRALGQILDAEESPVVWEEAATTQPFAPAAAIASGFKPRLMLVEDDVHLRKLLARQLDGAGYLVEAVGDGQAALQLAVQKPFDALVADLDLPKLDGWGLLRRLRADVVHREIAVMVLSAHEAEVDTLKAARAGARAYLKKSGKARELTDAVALLVRPRAQVWDALSARRDVKVELRSVGAIWLLRMLAELDCQGTLEIEDALGRASVVTSQGHLVRATAAVGSSLVKGEDAVKVVLASRGEGRFRFSKEDVGQGARWIYEIVDELCARARAEEQAVIDRAMASPGTLFFNDELAALFARHASVRELRVLDAVRSSPDSLDALAAMAGVQLPELEPMLAELLRRGVLASSADAA